jgi:hypothetical protein
MSSIIQEIINDKFNINEIKSMYKMFNNKLRYQIKKIIIYKYIYKMYLDEENKFYYLVNFITKMKNKTIEITEYNQNIKLIYKIFKLNKIDIQKLRKELFKLKPIDEQNQIKERNKLVSKMKFSLMTNLEKTQYYQLRKEKKIEKIGYYNYKIMIRNKYNKWYNNLSTEKKIKLKNNRNLKYKNMPFEAKQKLLLRHRMYYKIKSKI